MGNVTKDPWVNEAKTFAAFDLAISCERFVSKGNYEKYTIFKRCLFHGYTVKLVERFVAKGKCILVEGKLGISVRKDRETGENREEEVIEGDNLSIVDKGSRNGGGHQTRTDYTDDMPYAETAGQAGMGNDGDLPF